MLASALGKSWRLIGESVSEFEAQLMAYRARCSAVGLAVPMSMPARVAGIHRRTEVEGAAISIARSVLPDGRGAEQNDHGQRVGSHGSAAGRRRKQGRSRDSPGHECGSPYPNRSQSPWEPLRAQGVKSTLDWGLSVY